MNWIELEKDHIFQTYKRFPLEIESGKGVWVFDRQGKKYLDFLTGIAVNALGHCHPAITAAITEQCQKLSHTSNLYYTESMLLLAQKLVNLSKLERVFFCNSGAEANEAAIKLTRKYQAGKYEIITCHQSFHGRTLATITATGQPKYQKGFEPLMPGFSYVPYNDLATLEKAITEKTGAIMVEPIQGEGGVVIPDKNYLHQIRELCDDRRLLLILDEVQTGCGRTGKFFCFEHSQIKPDIVTLAKALGGGLPIGACLASEKVAAAFQFGDHAATFGGNSVSCAAGLAFIRTLESEKLLEKCRTIGDYFLNQLVRRLISHTLIRDIRGMGLMLGIELAEEVAGEIVNKCLEQGLLIGTAGPKVIRFLPPYILSEADVNLACDILVKCMK
ncbi:acetylornithine transaminase [candidate division KSB1 bacterium]|nr:acetylornithine transaminase [candidate division KSB1 bacterium]